MSKVILVIFKIFLLVFSSLSSRAEQQCSEIFQKNTSQFEIIFAKSEVNHKALEIIQSAQKTLDITISSIPQDNLVDLLLGKANAGVKIRLILSGRHFQKNSEIERAFSVQLKKLDHPSIDLRITSSLSLAGNREYQGAVFHRKIIIVDSDQYYVGSSNLSDSQNNVEIGLFSKVKTDEVSKIFQSDFEKVQNRNFKTFDTDAQIENLSEMWIGPNTQRPHIQKEIIKEIQNSKNRILIGVLELTDSTIIDELIRKKNENPNIDLRILVSNEKRNLWFLRNKLNYSPNSEAVKRLSKHNIPVRFHEDDSSILHSRLIIIDDHVIGGSFDFTQRAFEGNIDLGFEIKEQEPVKYIHQQFENLWSNAPKATAAPFSFENTIANLLEQKIFPRLSVRSAPNKELQMSYGWEVEFLPKETPGILKYYKLKSFTDQEWEALSIEQRIDVLDRSIKSTPKLIRTLFSYFGFSYLVRLESAPGSLPEKALLEAHGTVELVGEVEFNQNDLQTKTKNIEDLIGKGYWQSHVVFPKIHSENISGWIAFTSDYATLSTLETSYKSYLKNSQQIPGSILSHYAMGALDQATYDSIKIKESKATKGSYIGSGGSGRLIFGPAFRDDVYPDGLVGVELRQFSKRRIELMKEVDTLTKLMTKNQLFIFNGFKETKMLDFKLLELLPKEDQIIWEPFLKSLDQSLRKSSQSVAVGGATYALRFLTPLRDWENHPILLLSKKSPAEIQLIRNQISSYRQNFIQEVSRIISLRTSTEEKIKLMRIAVSHWANECQLGQLFEEY